MDMDQQHTQPLSVMDLSLDLSSDSLEPVKSVLRKYLFRQRPRDLELTPLSGGITNSLLKGTVSDNDEFLVRAYGNGTDSIINRDREYATHLHLLSHKLAPDLYARFRNGLIYGYVPGRPIDYTDMSNPVISPAIANRLSQWHSLLDPVVIEDHILKLNPHNNNFSKNLWDVLNNWIDVMPRDVLDVTPKELKEEIAWFRENYGDKGGPVVVCHCDLLSGNIIIPNDLKIESQPEKEDVYSYPSSLDLSTYRPSELVTFIDYEYTLPAPRAFDLANHFSEWQGFDCRTDLIPEPSRANRKLRYWCFHYLAASHWYKSDVTTKINNIESEIDDLISQLQNWWGFPGLYWSIWGCIQSQISDIDFDYATYCKSRLSEYFLWKKNATTITTNTN